MRVTFLGTGTSVGVPVITCDCSVCASDDPRNNRLRAGLLLEWPLADGDGHARVLVDTTTDLRQQALRAGIPRVDAVLYTHQHADHVLGLDELRIYNFVHRVEIPLYGNHETIDSIRKMFSYAFDGTKRGVPRLELCPVSAPFDVCGTRVIPVTVQHHKLSIYGYRIGDFAYVTDCSGIPEESAAALQGLDLLVIDALRRAPHPAHFTLDEALAEIERLAPRRALLTHLSHEFEHAALAAELPDHVDVAYDGLAVEMP